MSDYSEQQVRVDSERFAHADRMISRREELKKLGLCINGPKQFGVPGFKGVVHGPVVRSGKCQRCLDVWKGKAWKKNS